VQERLEVLGGDLPALDRVDDCAAHWITGGSTSDVVQERIPPRAEPVRFLLVGQGRGEVVDDLIGVSCEPVEGVDVGPLGRGK
jgi:hypothetical protein